MRLPEHVKDTVAALIPVLSLSGCLNAHHPGSSASLEAPKDRTEEHFLKEVQGVQGAVKEVIETFMGEIGLGYAKVDLKNTGWNGKPWYYPNDFHIEALECYGQIGRPTDFSAHLDPSLYASCVTYVPQRLMSDPLYRGSTLDSSAHEPKVFVELLTERPDQRPVRTLPEERGDQSNKNIRLMRMEGEKPESPLCVGGTTAYRYWSVDQSVFRPGVDSPLSDSHDHYEASMEEATHFCPTEEGRWRHYTTYVFQSSDGENYHPTKGAEPGSFEHNRDLLIHPLVSETFAGGVGYDRLYRMRSSSAPLEGHAEGYGTNRHHVYEPRKTVEWDANGAEIQAAMAETFESVWEELMDAEEAVQRANARE